ncbi:hypothetical protein QJS04_geneDACA022877 [Acorus gramineus]|uniref:CMP/dCMP-type deaminase domain-containing protein n=1 Tax=Acorus gramineus TaxID=55184 RepID=A0AAV9B0K4_ACOGR|nr:hypothetical protein QJS04_geneDACA022877 [Acorus gramineus]
MNKDILGVSAPYCPVDRLTSTIRSTPADFRPMGLQNVQWGIIHVSDKQPSRDEPTTVNVFASKIEPKLANTLVRRLCKIAPLEDLRHVKRVRKTSVGGKIELSVILCTVIDCENQEDMPSGVLEIVSAYQLRPYLTNVSKFAASSREEWEEQCTGSYNHVSCLNPWSWMEQKAHAQNSIMVDSGSTTKWHPLRHATLVAIENAASRDRRLYPRIPAKRQKTQNSDNEEEHTPEAVTNGLTPEATRPYLCTGYDIYIAWEPCTMCAMALVHQRIRRIFYAFPNPNAGALNSIHRLQGEKSLNHHYSVFRILLDEKSS